jgi:hypothetical protein
MEDLTRLQFILNHGSHDDDLSSQSSVSIGVGAAYCFHTQPPSPPLREVCAMSHLVLEWPLALPVPLAVAASLPVPLGTGVRRLAGSIIRRYITKR